MPPLIALSLWFVLLLALLCFDPAKIRGTSAALWVPIAWMFIAGSRLPSQWLGAITGQQWLVNLQDGNPLDRSVDLFLIILAIAILLSRSFEWGSFFKRNTALTAFIIFALLSVIWSDFPVVAFKRWFRDLGNYIMVFVVLSDPHPVDAVRTVFRRLGYLLVPLSITLDKYFPAISKFYDEWSGASVYTGVATSKNTLGLVALIAGVFFFWDIVARWSERKDRRARRVILLNMAFLVMSISLLRTANSTTCKVCMLIGCVLILVVHSGWGRRHPGFLKAAIPATFLSYVVLAFGFGMLGKFAAAVGKDPTLTDRTKIWSFLLGMHTNPLLGTGYESFWIGPRLQWFWTMSGQGRINEAHNGFLEVYLNLGIIGVLLILGVLIGSHWNICKRLVPFSSFASLNLAVWTIMLFFCMTEAGFRGGLMWLAFLLVAVSIKAREPVPSAVPWHPPLKTAPYSRFPPAAPAKLQGADGATAPHALPGLAERRSLTAKRGVR
jgi:exopolysaccharide production protein ExoQ